MERCWHQASKEDSSQEGTTYDGDGSSTYVAGMFAPDLAPNFSAFFSQLG